MIQVLALLEANRKLGQFWIVNGKNLRRVLLTNTSSRRNGRFPMYFSTTSSTSFSSQTNDDNNNDKKNKKGILTPTTTNPNNLPDDPDKSKKPVIINPFETQQLTQCISMMRKKGDKTTPSTSIIKNPDNEDNKQTYIPRGPSPIPTPETEPDIDDLIFHQNEPKHRHLYEDGRSQIGSSSTEDDDHDHEHTLGLVHNFIRPSSQRIQRKDVSLERNFVTPVRAMTDFLLKSADLQGLRVTMRRSPHPDEPPIKVYWRKDIEAKAIEIWGSLDELLREKKRRDRKSKEYNEAVFNIKRILRKYRQQAVSEVSPKHSTPTGPSDLRTGSGKIVLAAIAINGTNFLVKIIAWWWTGSHSLFAEAIHSLADTGNQLILAYGIHKSNQEASMEHPYGYAHMRHVASLISGVGIFCVGAGLSVYHGITGLIYQEQVESLYWAFYILAGSFFSEGITLYLAASAVRQRAVEAKMKISEYIFRGQDPALNVVILEDSAAVLGVLIASCSMGLTTLWHSPIPDACGSLVIGGLLAGVASFIIYSNTAALVGRTIPSDKLDRINSALESDVMVRAIHDVKGIDMGNSQIRYKAEVDFDGRELAQLYVYKLDVARLFQEVKKMKTDDEFEEFLIQNGENIVDILGSEIDRIETKLKTLHPEIRHCDLEIL